MVLLHHHRLRVHGNIEHARGESHNKKQNYQGSQVWRNGNEWHKNAIQEHGEDGDAPAAIADDEPTRERHGKQRANRRGKQNKTKRTVIDGKYFLHARKARSHVSMNKSIDEEDKLDGNARGMHGRMDMVV
jgi:hypothetical protein